MGGTNLEWVEQIWSGWSKFGVGGVDVGRTVWRVADNLEKTLLCKFLFSWAKFLKLDTYICDRIRENVHVWVFLLFLNYGSINSI